jgi:hypothetical protein
MADYPTGTFAQRLIENLPSEVYDPAQKYKLYAEDVVLLGDEVTAIETELGASPKGAAADVAARLTDIEGGISDLESGKQDALGFTPEDVANKDTNTALGTSDSKYPSQKAVKIYIDNAIATAKLADHPIGNLYFSITNTNPGTFLGGTWDAWGSGRVPVGVDAGQTEFNTVEKTGGAKTHTLAIGEVPSHYHSRTGGNFNSGVSAGVMRSMDTTGWNDTAVNTDSKGGGGSHNNLQPYITCYIFKRTA